MRNTKNKIKNAVLFYGNGCIYRFVEDFSMIVSLLAYTDLSQAGGVVATNHIRSATTTPPPPLRFNDSV